MNCISQQQGKSGILMSCNNFYCHFSTMDENSALWSCILAGVLTQVAIEKGMELPLIKSTGYFTTTKRDMLKQYEKLCEHKGAGYWLELCLVPLTFAVICGVRAPSENVKKCLLTLFTLLVLNITVNDFGHFALLCAGFDFGDLTMSTVVTYVFMGIPAFAALTITIWLLCSCCK